MFVAHGDLAEFYNNLCRNSVILKSDVNHPSGILQTRPYDEHDSWAKDYPPNRIGGSFLLLCPP